MAPSLPQAQTIQEEENQGDSEPIPDKQRYERRAYAATWMQYKMTVTGFAEVRQFLADNWHAVRFARQILLAMLIGFMAAWGGYTDRAQLAFFFIVCVSYLGLLLFTRPYKRTAEFVIDIIFSAALVLAIILLFVLLAYDLRQETRKRVAVALVWINWAAIVAYYLLTLPVTVYNLIMWFRYRGAKKDLPQSTSVF